MTEERRLAAIMFSDICSFSKIMGEDEERALAIVEMHKGCIESGTQVHSGRIIKEMGDGMLVEFPSAVNAVRCAMDIQKAVSQHNSSAPEYEQFQLRIGIHVGDVVVADGDILGDGVNVASRIEPLAEPGGICISRDIFDLVRNKISIETVHLGAHDLKNISRQVSIYKVLLDAVGGGAAMPPEMTKKRPPWLNIAIAAGVIFALLFFVSVSKKKKTEQAPPPPAETTPTPEQIIQQRQVQFMKAVFDKDKEKALSYLPPTAQLHGDKDKIWMRLSMISGIFKLGKLTKEDFRVKFVHVGDDGLSGDIVLQVRKKTNEGEPEEWNDTKPSRWILINGQWYIDIKSPQPTGQPMQPPEPQQRQPGMGRPNKGQGPGGGRFRPRR